MVSQLQAMRSGENTESRKVAEGLSFTVLPRTSSVPCQSVSSQVEGSTNWCCLVNDWFGKASHTASGWCLWDLPQEALTCCGKQLSGTLPLPGCLEGHMSVSRPVPSS